MVSRTRYSHSILYHPRLKKPSSPFLQPTPFPTLVYPSWYSSADPTNAISDSFSLGILDPLLLQLGVISVRPLVSATLPCFWYGGNVRITVADGRGVVACAQKLSTCPSKHSGASSITYRTRRGIQPLHHRYKKLVLPYRIEQS